MRNSDIAVLVYRDPVERLVSLFANKFVERSDSADLAKKYEQTTGHSASRATLEDFVFRYLSRAGRLRPDPHLRRRGDHLTGLLYCAIPLRRVHEDMKILVGPALADEYFARPVNAASSPKVTPSDDAVRLIRKVYAADIELLKRIEESPRLNQP